MPRTAACLVLVIQAFVALTLAAPMPDGCPCPQKPAAHVDRQLWVFSLLLGGRNNRIPVYESDFADAPPWDPLSGSEQPVSLGEAIRLATSEVQRTFADFEHWAFGSIGLQKLGDDHWVYVVQWGPVNHQEEFAIVLVPVLMSGQVIPLDRRENR